MAASPPWSWPESRRSGKDKNVDDDGFWGFRPRTGTFVWIYPLPLLQQARCGRFATGIRPAGLRKSRAGECQIPKNLGVLSYD